VNKVESISLELSDHMKQIIAMWGTEEERYRWMLEQCRVPRKYLGSNKNK